MKSIVRNLMILYLVLLLAVWGAITFDTGSSWWVSLFLFSPRWVLGLPWLVLFPLTLLVHFRLAWLYVLHLAILLFPLLDVRLPLTSEREDAASERLRLMTCNLGEGPIRIEQLVKLVQQHNIDVLVLQESGSVLSQGIFERLSWHYHQSANLAIGSRLPLGPVQVISAHSQDAYPTVVAMAADITLQDEPVAVGDEPDNNVQLPQTRIASVHFPTFRPAFEKAQHFDYSGAEEFDRLAISYRDYVEQTLAAINDWDTPRLIAGDFNVPEESTFYRDYWTHFQNALSVAGCGLCYTKYTRFHGVRIDHVLADEQWRILSAEVGPNLGGDHRPVIVELQRLARSQP